MGELVRDKDGIGAALVFADLAGFCRSRGTDVLAYLRDIYRRFGIYVSSQKSVTLPGAEGLAEIRAIMDGFRADPPSAIGGTAIRTRSDLLSGVTLDLAAGRESEAGFPRSNVIVYELEDRSRVLLRPSGTEPKIKYYFEAVEPPAEGEEFPALERRAADRLRRLEDAFLEEAGRRAP